MNVHVELFIKEDLKPIIRFMGYSMFFVSLSNEFLLSDACVTMNHIQPIAFLGELTLSLDFTDA